MLKISNQFIIYNTFIINNEYFFNFILIYFKNMTIMLLINAILFILNIKFPSVYETSSVLVWLGLLIITVFYFIKAVYRFFEEEDDYIWNLQ